MTTVELFNRIGRRSRDGDFTKLGLTEKVDVLEAANAGLQMVYNALPQYFKEQSEGFLLPAPRPITVSVTQFSNMLSSDVFDVAELGRSVVLDGDPAWNQVIDTNQMLNPYMGATGVASGTVYGNAVYSDQYPVDRIIGDPKFANQNAAPFFNCNIVRGSNQGVPWMFQQGIGVPRTWWVEMLGNAQGYEPLMVMRFAPAPAIAYSISVRLSFWPRRLTLADYTSASTLPVPDQFLEPCLIPLAIRQFMSSPTWRESTDDPRVETRALAAEAFLKNQPGQVASPNNRVYTPLGY